MGSGLMGTLAQGMAFGAGSAVAHQAIRSVMGSGSGSSQDQTQQQQQAPQQQTYTYGQQQQQEANRCQTENSSFVECLKFNNNEIAKCQDQFNTVQKCQAGL